ncbi:hypothetical protein PanWU01x14_072220 [Parasponia andersonii]|uniref:Uncharacterized protein n=1 Tax=Parasponia andersonii TaxID=3476 RepID=A0A2P5DDP6_PARAD|nr:hypothetical protein PanWU01x14_072220 [Parasponia andersonii]
MAETSKILGDIYDHNSLLADLVKIIADIKEAGNVKVNILFFPISIIIFLPSDFGTNVDRSKLLSQLQAILGSKQTSGY